MARKETIMKSSNRSPQLLPWLANKAGLPLSRVEELWQAAERHAARTAGETDTSNYYAAAMDRLYELVAAASLRADAASFGWRPWMRFSQQAWQAPVALLDAFALNSARGWRTRQHSLRH
jgi:hypothetical protein